MSSDSSVVSLTNAKSSRIVSLLAADQKMQGPLIRVMLKALQHRYKDPKYRGVQILAQAKALQAEAILFPVQAL